MFLRFLIFGGLAIIGAAGYIMYSKSKSRENAVIPDKTVDKLIFDDVVQYFKSEEVANLLSNNSSYIATVTRKRDGDSLLFSLAVFDKSSNKAIKLFIIKANSIDEATASIFGEKDMVVLS